MRVVRTASVRTIQTRRLLPLLKIAIIAVAMIGAAPARAQDAEKARQLFQQGSKYYDVGQFDKAIEAWQQGYDQKSDPSFLYNIAQAYRQKQDAAKAIFFYKGYLRNSPKAHNRAEVDQKIAVLQKQLDAATPPPGNTPPPPNNTAPPPNNTTPPNNTNPTVTVTTNGEPPPVGTEPVTPPPDGFTETPATTLVQTGPPAAAVSDARLDLTGAVGPAFWSSGVNGTASASLAFNAGFGYYFGAPMARFRFRAGGLFGLTFLGANEDGSNVYFTSFLLDPALEIRLTSSGRWYGVLDLGLGIQMLSGMKARSKLLAANETLSVNGAQGLFESRLGATVGYRWTPELALFSGLSSINSPQKQHFYAPIARVELMFGLAYRF
jgi:tetratricopeptide (TPR) repeat protein